MSKLHQLDQLLKTNRGFIKTSDVVKMGISRPYFSEYKKMRDLIKVAQGLYMTQDTWQDDLYVIQVRYPKVIFSHETAAFLLGLADREPFEPSVTLETGYGSARLNKSGVKVFKVRKELVEIGLIEMDSPVGNRIRTFNAERTLCDLIRNRSSIEIQGIQTAFKEYFKMKEKNIPQLMRYAKLFSVENNVKQYTEVLL